MSLTFLHLSDIHFGQDRGGTLVVHNDVRERVVDDVRDFVANSLCRNIDGIIVSGDLAYGGSAEQYTEAAQWLDRLSKVAGCPITEIQVVPGNHDINREGICRNTKRMLEEIASEGESELDAYLEHPKDREVFYARFEDYREFAEGYDCPLDREGGAAGEKLREIAEERRLRFIGLNSALLCSICDSKGKLLLGARQLVLPITPGEELVVICHHPLDWFLDSDEAKRYIRSRARVFVSGHEHAPEFELDAVGDRCDLLRISAGAVTPPNTDDVYTYSYNFLEFEWESCCDGLSVKIYPRVWSPEKTAFVANVEQFGAESVNHNLGCPNFRNGRPKMTLEPSKPTERKDQNAQPNTTENETRGGGPEIVQPAPERFQYLLLRFFRDLKAPQRLAILIEMNALPTNWTGSLTHAMERRAFDSLRSGSDLDTLERLIEEALNPDVGDQN